MLMILLIIDWCPSVKEFKVINNKVNVTGYCPMCHRYQILKNKKGSNKSKVKEQFSF